MAIIACKECAREVSDKAACCPYCGVSIAGVVRRRRRFKRWLYGMLIASLLAWGTLTTLWLAGMIPVPKELVGFITTGSDLVRTVKVPTVKASENTVEQAPPVERAAPPVATAQSAPELKPVNSAVYRTSVEQLYQAYDANEVAIQTKIADSDIRVSGTVAEIDEDPSGQPVVTLHTGGDNRADMVLTDDQRSAAAQLSKEDTVEIQCRKMQRIAARLHGSGCALVLVDADVKPVYLAVSLSSKGGHAPLYIVGPMSQKSCLASSDAIAAQVTSNPKNDRILSKSCAATARESISVGDCHLNSTMSAIPDIPNAHLWKYDCMAPALESRRAAETATSRSTPIGAAAPAATAATATSSQPTPGPAVAPSDSDAPAPKLENTPPSDGGAAPAAVETRDEASPQQPTPAAETTSSTSTAPTPPTTVADDLIPVRTKDPEAADRIASYCSKITSSATDPTTVAARCRQDEMEAWNRLTIQNEFPTLDETSRRKCNEPPFPDSFVARETCAKYQLHLD